MLRQIHRAGPYRPLAAYAVTDEERRASGGGDGVGGFVPPWFRTDMATFGECHAEGTEPLLGNPRFVDAARQVFGQEVLVEPTTLYVNVMAPASFPFVAHLDVPVFRGANRANTPVWLLKTMHASGLFESERIRMATAVSWFYDGPGGDFHYWPDGPDGPSRLESPPFTGAAVVADNEQTFHGVAPVGEGSVESPTDLSLDAVMNYVPSREEWVIEDHDRVVAALDLCDVRVTTSWKAQIHRDAAERALVRSGEGNLDVETIVGRLDDDLTRRDAPAPRASDPLTDPEWMEALSDAYPQPMPPIPPA